MVTILDKSNATLVNLTRFEPLERDNNFLKIPENVVFISNSREEPFRPCIRSTRITKDFETRLKLEKKIKYSLLEACELTTGKRVFEHVFPLELLSVRGYCEMKKDCTICTDTWKLSVSFFFYSSRKRDVCCSVSSESQRVTWSVKKIHLEISRNMALEQRFARKNFHRFETNFIDLFP